MTTSSTTAAPSRVALPAAVRRAALVALLPLPLWVLCFVLLYGALPEKFEGSAAEGIAYLQSGGAAIWGFAMSGLVAVLAMAFACISWARSAASRSAHRVVVLLAQIASSIGVVAFLVNWVATIGALTTDATHPADWVVALAEGSVASTTLNGIAWVSLTVAVALVAFALRGSGLLGRSGTVIGMIAAVIAVAMSALLFFVPMAAAVLLFATGLTLLLRRT